MSVDTAGRCSICGQYSAPNVIHACGGTPSYPAQYFAGTSGYAAPQSSIHDWCVKQLNIAHAEVARLTGELAELKAARDSDKPAWHRMQDALHGWSHRATDAEAEVSRLSARVAELEQNLKQSIERPWVGPLSDE